MGLVKLCFSLYTHFLSLAMFFGDDVLFILMFCGVFFLFFMLLTVTIIFTSILARKYSIIFPVGQKKIENKARSGPPNKAGYTLNKNTPTERRWLL